jgi:tetratricopeptide (TPR) repeat protein
MNLLPRIGIVKLLIRVLMLTVLSASPLMADYFNSALVADSQDPVYWLDQGGLFATYGNYYKAVESYKKALTLDENNSKAHYDLAVAYGELDQLDEALAEINRAIALDAEQGRYYYGRAWIQLKSGRSAAAMEDFQKAADMGDLDAIAFIADKGGK